ncbi:MAG: CAP domain-containing protein [Acidimicrobiaceae bacterium]|nr:CAP domain-containing protein [Acidimicrobiaceae bacterium]
MARAWSLTMRDWDIFEHNPYFSRQFPRGWTRAAENIAFVSGRAFADAVQVAFDGLVGSPGHYANMTNPEFNHIGVGIAFEESSFWFTQNFAHYP